MENIICLWKFIQIEKEKMHVKNNEVVGVLKLILID